MKLEGVALGCMLAISAAAVAATPNPADYTTTVHVTSEEIAGNDSSTILKMDVVVNGQKFKLIGGAPLAKTKVIGGVHPGLLPLGDYKAKLVKENYQPAYLRFDSYELLLPDGKTSTFRVVGQSE